MSIRERIRHILGMASKPTLNIRFSNAILKRMDELIDSGDYTSMAEIVNRAVAEFLLKEEMRPVIREEIKKILDEKGMQ